MAPGKLKKLVAIIQAWVCLLYARDHEAFLERHNATTLCYSYDESKACLQKGAEGLKPKSGRALTAAVTTAESANAEQNLHATVAVEAPFSTTGLVAGVLGKGALSQERSQAL